MRERIWKQTLHRVWPVLCAAMLSQAARAEDLKPSDIRGPAKKKPVSVLQNRYFLKSYRPEVGISGGWFLNEAYTSTRTMGGRFALFFGEWIGAEVQYLKTNVSDSDDRKALNKLRYKRIDDNTVVSPDPEVNAVHSVTDATMVLAPFYGKLNFINALIVYTDIYGTIGLSKVDTDQGSKNALVLGAGQRFYWEKNISFRIDLRDRIYAEKRAEKNTTKNSLAIDFGVSYFFF